MPRFDARFPCRGESGFILVAVLWITMVLSIVALSYATTARLNGQTALNSGQRYPERYLLDSALEIGWNEYQKYLRNKTLLDKKEEIETLTGESLELWYPRFEPYLLSIEGMELAVRVLNEAGRLNINQVDAGQFTAVLKACGIEDPAQGTALFNAVSDWRDGDDLLRLEGAENEHYLGLTPPYHCKNGNIEAIEELLLIKGITRELYAGTPEHPGLVDFFTVVGETRKMDVNCASPRALALLGGSTNETATAVVEARSDKPIQSLSELSDVVPLTEYSLLDQFFAVSETAILNIQVSRVLEGQTMPPKIVQRYAPKQQTQGLNTKRGS